MPGKTRDYAARSLARILKERTDPHGYPMNDETIVRRLTISDEGGVKMWLFVELKSLTTPSSHRNSRNAMHDRFSVLRREFPQELPLLARWE